MWKLVKIAREKKDYLVVHKASLRMCKRGGSVLAIESGAAVLNFHFVRREVACGILARPFQTSLGSVVFDRTRALARFIQTPPPPGGSAIEIRAVKRKLRRGGY